MGTPGPNVVVIGGPNGAGKSTAAPALLRDTLAVSEFVNADQIARGLSGFHPQGSALAAGRVMLARLDELALRGVDFAFESTLASRRFAPWLARLARERDYAVHVLFLWLPDVETALARVRGRARAGGHDVPEPTVRRRYQRSIRNFFDLYRRVAGTWRVYDNTAAGGPELIARRLKPGAEEILDEGRWRRFQACG